MDLNAWWRIGRNAVPENFNPQIYNVLHNFLSKFNFVFAVTRARTSTLMAKMQISRQWFWFPHRVLNTFYMWNSFFLFRWYTWFSLQFTGGIFLPRLTCYQPFVADKTELLNNPSVNVMNSYVFVMDSVWRSSCSLSKGDFNWSQRLWLLVNRRVGDINKISTRHSVLYMNKRTNKFGTNNKIFLRRHWIASSGL